MFLSTLLKLNQIPRFGSSKIIKLLEHLNFDEINNMQPIDFKSIGLNSSQINAWFNPDFKMIEQIINWQNSDQHIIHIFMDEYPFLLKQISNPPIILFVKGDKNILNDNQIAVIGSRNCSRYGEYWAYEFSKKIVQSNLVVTSGLALGIDGISHKSSIENSGKTIAVLGSGLDNIYPHKHQKLAQNIIDSGGAVISEFYPKALPKAENFPRRNRIISGMSLGILVVEASLKSGSLITARLAMEQNRDVFVIPGAIQNSYSQGSNNLIKQGAILVDDFSDILNNIKIPLKIKTDTPITSKTNYTQTEFNFSNQLFSENINKKTSDKTSEKNNLQPFPKKDENRWQQLPEIQQKIGKHINFKAISIDDLSVATGITIENILVELLDLELNGLILNINGGYVLA